MNLIGVVLAGLFIAMVLALSQLLLSAGRVSPFAARKVVHVAVGHWWPLAMVFHDNAIWASIGPGFFIIFNAINHQARVLTATETEATRNNWGTVYYPVALLILVWLSFAGPLPKVAAAVGILSLGWGDGLAPLGGDVLPLVKIRLFGGTKTLGGTFTVFAASAVVAAIVSALHLGPAPLSDWALVVILPALTAAILELVTPFGLDNLSVPIGVSLVYWLVLP